MAELRCARPLLPGEMLGALLGTSSPAPVEAVPPVHQLYLEVGEDLTYVLDLLDSLPPQELAGCDPVEVLSLRLAAGRLVGQVERLVGLPPSVVEDPARACAPRACRVCGCTELDCSGCIERTGEPCHWVEANLCSACPAVPVGGDR